MTYNSYYGNAMNMSGSYCIHYGRKGMKWYQNIFEGVGDVVKSARSAYSGAKESGANVKKNAGNMTGYAKKSYLSKHNNGYASYGTMYGAANKEAQTHTYLRNSKDADSVRYGRYNDKVSRIGNAIGVTAYNTVEFVRRTGEKIAEAAKIAWNKVKEFGSKAITAGKNLLSSIFGRNKNKSPEKTTFSKEPVHGGGGSATRENSSGYGRSDLRQKISSTLTTDSARSEHFRMKHQNQPAWATHKYAMSKNDERRAAYKKRIRDVNAKKNPSANSWKAR